MHPNTLADCGRFLWGGRWHVSLSRILKNRPEDIRRMVEGGEPIGKDVEKAIVWSLNSRIEGARRRLERIEADQ